MTRETRQGKWVMVCDNPCCEAVEGPFEVMPHLADMARQGWFIAALYGDRCPRCPAPTRVEAHKVMKTVKRRKLVKE